MTMYPNRLGLVIGVPSSGNPVVIDWAFGLHNLHPPMDFNVEYCIVRGKPVADARNFIAEQAVEKKAKYLFFIDEDVTPPGHAVRQLIYHLENWPKAAIAAGIYCHKSDPPNPMVFRGNGIGPYWDWKVGEVFDCSGVGMGCTMIRVDAFKTIDKPWFKTVDNIDKFYDGEPSAEMWTEDLFLCKKLTDAGWMILADGGILPNHWDPKSGKAWNLPPTSKPLMPVAMSKGKKKVVDLGSGPPEESYSTNEGEVLRVDIREDAKPDFRCDVRKTPFATGEFDIVFSSHTLEHFARYEVPEVLDEWTRILKPDGEMRLLLPNMEWAAQHIMNKEIDNDVMNVLYGAQTYEQNFHKTGFTQQVVEQLLAERGFTHFEWDTENYHMFVRAFKVIPKGGVPVLGCVARMGEAMNHPLVNSSNGMPGLALDPQAIMKEDAVAVSKVSAKATATIAPSEVISYNDEPMVPNFAEHD